MVFSIRSTLKKYLVKSVNVTLFSQPYQEHSFIPMAKKALGNMTNSVPDITKVLLSVNTVLLTQ